MLTSVEDKNLQYTELSLEKCIKNIIEKWKSNDINKEIIKNLEYLTYDRLNDHSQLNTTLKKLWNQLQETVNKLKNQKKYDITDYEQFKCDMIALQNELMQLKSCSKSELNKLTAIEEDLTVEVKIYDEKLSQWNTKIPPFISYNPSGMKIQNRGQYQEINRFLDFVQQSGGHENGWRKEDHSLFLKLRKTHKNTQNLSINLHKILPDLSLEEIIQHEEWYKTYLSLLQKKKEAINRWRLEKVQPKTVSHPITADKKPKEPKFISLPDQIIQWKLSREKKLAEEEENRKQQTLDKIMKNKLRLQQQLETRQMVNEWRDAKQDLERTQMEQLKLNEEHEKKRRAVTANRLIKQFQSLDELYLMKKRQRQWSKESKVSIERSKSCKAQRDPSRLMKPTIQWTKRTEASISEPLNFETLSLFTVPKLAVPNWRKDFS